MPADALRTVGVPKNYARPARGGFKPALPLGRSTSRLRGEARVWSAECVRLDVSVRVQYETAFPRLAAPPNARADEERLLFLV